MAFTDKYFRTQSALARRTVTAIRNLSEAFKANNSETQLGALSDKDQQDLDKAINVLQKVAAKYASAARDASEKASNNKAMYEKALGDAELILKDWKTEESIQSKVVMITATFNRHTLLEILEDAESKPSNLEELFTKSLREFSSSAAYRVSETKSITEVLNRAYQNYIKSKTSPEVLKLSHLWEAKINSQ